MENSKDRINNYLVDRIETLEDENEDLNRKLEEMTGYVNEYFAEIKTLREDLTFEKSMNKALTEIVSKLDIDRFDYSNPKGSHYTIYGIGIEIPLSELGDKAREFLDKLADETEARRLAEKEGKGNA